MDASGLRAAYEELLRVAALPGLGAADDGGWCADELLAHLIAVDATLAATAIGVVAGARPGFDNRVALDAANLSRVVARHPDRTALVESVRSTAELLCDVAERLDEADEQVLVPALLVSGDAVVLDQPVPLGGLVAGLASDHVPRHTEQLARLAR